MKKIIFLSLFSLPFLSQAQGSLGEVVGTVISKKDKFAIVNARVQTTSNGTIYGAKTDLDGRFRISAIPPGKYLFSIIYDGDTLSNILSNVPIEGIYNMGTIEFTSTTQNLEAIDINPDRIIILPDLPHDKLDRDRIKRSPAKFDQKAMIAAISSDVKLTDDGELVFRGARKGDMIYIMDGIKMNDVVSVPSAAIGSMMVYTGGIPAKYGDTTGGVVVMETASYFDLYRAWEAEQIRNSK